jgi:putative tryptophan/tyrosine transport system substrate-binding protein
MKRSPAFLLAFFFLTAPAVGHAKEEVLAVLSSDMGPYQEAFAGFQEIFGEPVEVKYLTSAPLHFRGQPRLVITFGGKAALQKYPEGSVLIYCMAPGTFVSLGDHAGVSVDVSMMPKPGDMLQKLKEMQPSLKRLGVLWLSPSFEVYAKELHRAAAAESVELLAEKLEGADGLPNRLRSFQGRVDALWLPPDPLLLANSANIVVMAQFSWANHIPLYTAVPGLAEQGAVASLSSTYREIGHAAGRAARMALEGKSLPAEVYPETSEATINPQAAAKAGIDLPKSVLDNAQKVQP